MVNIHVVDEIMGRGKSVGAINYINNSAGNVRFIFVTPYLEETERIMSCCKKKNFVAPEAKYGTSKRADLVDLIKERKNIVTTHAMLSLFTKEIIALISENNYIMILDEVANVIKAMPTTFTEDDYDNLFSTYLELDESNSRLSWKANKANYNGVYNELKEEIDTGNIYYSGIKYMPFIWCMPTESFTAFKEVFILTYMFAAQIQSMYYNINGINYDYWHIEGDTLDTFQFAAGKAHDKPLHDYKELIHVFTERKINEVGKASGTLSWNWYHDNINNKGEIKKINNNMANFFRAKKCFYKDGKFEKCPSKEALWTTYKEMDGKKLKNMVSAGSGVAKGFDSCNMRATNKWSSRHVVAYLCNRFVNPNIIKFLINRGIEKVSSNGYALSEMLQFIWRSGIRNGDHITVYVPSKRMRRLLIDWIDRQHKLYIAGADEGINEVCEVSAEQSDCEESDRLLAEAEVAESPVEAKSPDESPAPAKPSLMDEAEPSLMDEPKLSLMEQIAELAACKIGLN